LFLFFLLFLFFIFVFIIVLLFVVYFFSLLLLRRDLALLPLLITSFLGGTVCYSKTKLILQCLRSSAYLPHLSLLVLEEDELGRGLT
jgi:hypothetical protein